jgi:hypothetical protein
VAYHHERAVADPDCFINKYIDFASLLTDASYDYHEAMALFLLSIATQGVKLMLPSMPNGLRTNLYIIQYGISSYSRKSTAMDIAEDIATRGLAGCQLPPSFTPGGLEESVSHKCDQPAALFADEFGRILDQMHHQSFMSGLRGFLLTMYAKENWEYRKISKGGKTKVEDVLRIEKSHLCIAGNVTPAQVKYIKPQDIEDGFLARFAMIWPQTKPKRKGMGDLEMDVRKRNNLVLHLSKIRQLSKNIRDVSQPGHPDHHLDVEYVKIDPYALVTIDKYQEELEVAHHAIDTCAIMSERTGIMAFKVAMLIAMSRGEPDTKRRLIIEQEDAVSAVSIARKWKDWGMMFAGSLYESDVEKHVRRAFAIMQELGPQYPRRLVAKRMRMSKRELDEVQMTMVDQGLIRLSEGKAEGSRKPTLFWTLCEDDPIEVKEG